MAPTKKAAPGERRRPIIGNQFGTGNTKIGNIFPTNKAGERRILAEMIPTLRSGYITYLRVCRALESNFEGD